MENKKFTKIGDIEIGNGIFLAPMEDVCDLPFRVVCKRLGADIVYTEFIASEGIIRESRTSKRKMIVAEEERPVAVQIFGGDIEAMVESAKIVEDAGADILDINFGCWVKKVVQREAGAAFLKKPDEMAELTYQVQNAVKIPVTVKTRLGWDKENIVIESVAKKIEQAGAKALAVHCRTRDMGMTGQADWAWIPKIKEVLNIPLILNGDVVEPDDVLRAFQTTPAVCFLTYLSELQLKLGAFLTLLTGSTLSFSSKYLIYFSKLSSISLNSKLSIKARLISEAPKYPFK